MTELEKAARQALDAMGLIGADLVCGASSHHRRADLHGDEDVCPITVRWHAAFAALSRALTQQAEPVTLTVAQQLRQLVDKFADEWNISDIEILSMAAYILEQQAEPAQAEPVKPVPVAWVGLTDAEIWSCPAPEDGFLIFARALEAKLKEKNAKQAERVLTEVDPITGITFKVTLKFDPEPVRAYYTIDELNKKYGDETGNPSF